MITRRGWLRGALATATAAVASACGLAPDRATPQADVAAAPAGPLRLVGGRVLRDGALHEEDLGVRDGVLVDPLEVAGAEDLDCAGLVLLPGLIDCHVHLQFSSPAAVLGGGVTTVRDLGSPLEAPGALGLAGASPLRIVAAGQLLTAPGGYPSRSWGPPPTSREVRGVADAADAVGEQLAAGATWIKVTLEASGGRPVLEPDVLVAIVDAAHAADTRVTAHVGGGPAMLRRALDAGVDDLAHLPLYDVTPDEMAAAARQGVSLVPTVALPGTPDTAVVALRAFLEAGGAAFYGTDLGNGGTRPGLAVGELAMLEAAGLTRAEVLDAATRDAAAYLGVDRAGRLEPGASADVLAVGGDPLEELEALRDVRLVLAGGAVVVDRRTDATA